LCSLLVLGACSEERETPEAPPVFADVEPILEESCLECHSGPAAAADYRVEDYLQTIYCVPDGQPATLPSDASAPIVEVLSRPDHQDLLTAEDTETLENWVFEGAVPKRRGAHPAQWNDPRSEVWHGAYLAATDWQGIVDPTSEDACGLCHQGSPAPVPRVEIFPPGATDCTSCHDMPAGVMACGTCHGDGERPYPPRDQCYFPGPPFGGLHDAHTQASAASARGLSCQSCHFGADYEMLSGSHGNGAVDVLFQPAWGPESSYDFDSQECATSCHGRGGSDPLVAWDQQLDLDCGSCHQNPPVGHLEIACNLCHQGINPAGTELTRDAPHLNGRVDAFLF
jgi:predicted CxxxxCH...CXXCH cytochrome family protein